MYTNVFVLQVSLSEVCALYLLNAHLTPSPRFHVLKVLCTIGHIWSFRFVHSEQILQIQDLESGILHRYNGWKSRGSFQQHLMPVLPRPLNTLTALCCPSVHDPYLACDNSHGFWCPVVNAVMIGFRRYQLVMVLCCLRRPLDIASY